MIYFNMYKLSITENIVKAKLRQHSLLKLFLSNELTIRRISSALLIRNSQLRRGLKPWGYGDLINDDTIVTVDMLKVIFTLKSRKAKVKREIIGNPYPKPKNKLLLENWKKRDNELKSIRQNPKAIIISTPVGGKVKK
jgi:hypothetical protein